MNTAIVSLLIMGGCIVLFVTDLLPIATTALLGCVAMIVFGVAKVSEVFSGFSGDIFLIILGTQIIGSAMFTSGAALIIGKKAVQLSKDNERLFIFISCLISAILSAFLANTAVIAMMMSISSNIAKLSKNMKLKNVIIPIAIASIFGGTCTLAGSTTQLVAMGFLEDMAGISFGFFELSYVGLPLVVVMLLFVTFIGYPIGKKIWEDEKETEIVKEFHTGQTELVEARNHKKAYIVLFIFALVVILFASNVVSVGTTAIIGAVLCIITGSISQKEAFSRLDWNVLIWLCCSLGLGNALSSSGGGELISNAFFRLIGQNPSPYLFFAAVVFIAMLLSMFMSNAVAVLIVLPAALSMATSMGFNLYPFAYAVSLSTSLTFATPLANGHIGMTMAAGYKFSDYYKYGLLFSIVTYILIILLTITMFPLT